MKPDEFEQRLSCQPLREIPRAWRGEILAAAKSASRPEPRAQRPAWLSTISQQLSTVFWPHPQAWAALAAVWVFIIAVNVSQRDPSPRMAEKSAPPMPEMLAELRQQQMLLAELIGPRETRDADRPRIFTPKPRGMRAELVVG